MTTSGFRDRLLRELARNKAKSAALGVLCLVACYFWLPLVAKFWTKKKDASPATVATEVTAAATVPAPAAIGELPEFRWKDFLTWMADEPRMTVMAVSASTRDPFGIAERVVLANAEGTSPDDTAVAATVPPEEPEVVRTPAEYGMTLRGTFVGGRTSTANIDGVNFRLGTVVPVPAPEGEVQDHSADGFQLVEVKPRFVVLERQGQQYRLELQSHEKSAKNIVIRSASQ